MTEVKSKCQLENCIRAASTRCFCCNKNVCTRHFTEHIEAVKAQIDPLVNDVNSMMERLQGLTIEKTSESSFAQLHQWRTDMYQLIDQIFLNKTKELENLIESNTPEFVECKKQQSQTLMRVQDEVRQLAEDGDATVEQIQLLRNQLNNVETSLNNFQKDFCSVNTKVFAQGLVTVTANLKKASPTSAHKQGRRTRHQQQQTTDSELPNSTTMPSSVGPLPTLNPSEFGFLPTTAPPFTAVFDTPITTTSSTIYGTSPWTSTNTAPTFLFSGNPVTTSSSTPTSASTSFLFRAAPITNSPFTVGGTTTTTAPRFCSFDTTTTTTTAPSIFSFGTTTMTTRPSLFGGGFGSSTASALQPNQQTSPFGATSGFNFKNTGKK